VPAVGFVGSERERGDRLDDHGDAGGGFGRPRLFFSAERGAPWRESEDGPAPEDELPPCDRERTSRTADALVVGDTYASIGPLCTHSFNIRYTSIIVFMWSRCSRAVRRFLNLLMVMGCSRIVSCGSFGVLPSSPIVFEYPDTTMV